MLQVFHWLRLDGCTMFPNGIAGICGIEAEAAQNKVKHLRMWVFECREPSHQAYMLGLAAAVMLAVAHLIAMFLGGCKCIFSRNDFQNASPNRQMSTAFFFLSWVIVGVGLGLLIIGTHSNDKSKGSCGFTHHHMMFIGGIMCFVHAVSSVAYYVSATAALY